MSFTLPSIVLSSPGAIAFHIGTLPIRWYALFITFGFIVATWVASRISKERGFSADQLLDLAMLVFLGGIVGARLYFAALSWNTFTSFWEIFQIWHGGLSIHGGIIGGAIAGYLYCRKNKLSFVNGCDVIAAAVPLAQAIGRWGNFFNSEAFGRPVDNGFPVRLQIDEQFRPPGMSDYQFYQPTFLYESVWNLAIFAVLYAVIFHKWKNRPGTTFIAYILLYSIGRALIEPLRTDSIMVAGVPAPFVVSVALVIAAAAALFLTHQYYARKEQKSPGEERLNEDKSEQRPQE
jgi:phosphatidylglycerol---prolipoprotein diacylglyceryl transferase